MKKLAFLAITALYLTACNSNNQEAGMSATTEETTHDHNHDHSAEETPQEEVKMVGEYRSYGAEITPDGALTPAELMAQLEGKDSVRVKLATSVTAACQKKGCWMKLNMGEGKDEMRVRFVDYGFFVPLDSEGDEAIVEGMAYVETTSVDMLKHYAEDAGKSEDEIAMITEPETKLTFMADGVLLK